MSKNMCTCSNKSSSPGIPGLLIKQSNVKTQDSVGNASTVHPTLLPVIEFTPPDSAGAKVIGKQSVKTTSVCASKPRSSNAKNTKPTPKYSTTSSVAKGVGIKKQ